MVYEFWNRMIPSDTTAIILFDLFLFLFMKCTKLCIQKPHGNIVILYSIMIISWHICIFSYSFSWFNLKIIAASHRWCYCLRDCEWMRCNAIIYHCMSWVICFSRLFIRDLFTNNDPVSIRPPSQSNAVLLFLLTAGASFSLSLFLWLSFFLCLTWTTRPFFPRHTAWIVWEDAGEKKRAWGCRDKETSGCVNALRLNVSVAVWPHTCDPVHNECVCVWVFTWECVYVKLQHVLLRLYTAIVD